MARLDAGVGEREVVAALGFEHRLFAEHFGEARRPGPCRDDEAVRSQPALRGADRRRPVVGKVEAGDMRRQYASAPAGKSFRQAGGERAGIDGMGALGKEGCMREDRRQPRFELAKLVAGQLLDLEAPLPLALPVACCRSEGPRALIDGERPVLPDEAGRPGLGGKVLVGVEGQAVESGHGIHLQAHRLRPARAHEADEPGEELRQVAPADEERPRWVQQPAGRLEQQAGARLRQAGVGADRAGIAEGGHGAGRLGVDQRDLMPVPAQVAGRRRADDSGPDDDDMLRLAHGPAYSTEPAGAAGGLA